MRRLKGARHLIGVMLAGATAISMPFLTGTASAAASDSAAAPSQAVVQQLGALAAQPSVLGLSQGSHPVLMLPKGTSAEERSKVVSTLPAGANATVRISQFTKADLSRLQTAVLSRDWIHDGQKYGLAASYDSAADKVDIDTDAPRSVTAPLLSAHPGTFEVHSARIYDQASRFNDREPFWGGSSITDGSSLCTSGFAIKDRASGHKYMLTAGHCFALNSTITINNHSASTFIGRVDRRLARTLDAETMSDSNYTGRIFAGGFATSATNRWIANWGNVRLGDHVCVSGQTTFNHCGHNVSNTGTNICYSGGTVCIGGLNAFIYDRGGTDPCSCNGNLTQGGDSGAPIYQDALPPGTGGILIYGMHSGVINQGDRQMHMVGVKVSALLAGFNADLVLGDT